jgi:molybdate transport system permease protein
MSGSDRVSQPRGARDRLWVLAIPGLLGLALLLVPLLGLVARAPWTGLRDQLTSGSVHHALRLSLLTSLAATAVSAILGVPLAWLLARTRLRGRSLLRAVVMLPMVLPPVVGGVALLMAFGRRGLVGQWLYESYGVTLPFTTAAVVIAQVFVSMPFLVIAVDTAFRASARGFEDAAATLGASRWYVFRRVSLPLVGPSIAAGAAVCWARALGEFGATITFAGNLPGRTQTIPLAVYLALQTNPEAALVLSMVLLAVSLGILVLLRDRWFPTT